MNTLTQRVYDFKLTEYKDIISLILAKADEASKLGKWNVEVDVHKYDIPVEDIRVIIRSLKDALSDSVFVTWGPRIEKVEKKFWFGISRFAWMNNYSKVGSITLEWKM